MSKNQMVIHYVPGEECRVAVVSDGRLEEFHAERLDGPSNHVGNIYVAKVANVEPGIQAAFVDFGLEANGFLHTSDVHPQYFPGEDTDTTERVGKKTPRRDRPPIQDCFRRGDEIAVQVLKEGVGTKGPTVTSYLSIPGRFLVMMPQMDKVGVSRKVEDEELRRKMRDILDQLDLPEGFGFILRTAGFDRTKAELKRDLAYLMRLWKDMEDRWRSGAGKPRLLYSESDLLVRALRDILSGEIEEIVVDNEAALSRAARFLKIVSPRTTTRLVHYTGKSPIFHAMGIEPQIQMMNAREVPLPSGGRLVIDEAEALVAIDVNSGKMRDARDAEATAYKTNMEAADEICRQLRLRDVGGVIVNDFIDMRQLKHRRDLETKMRDNLKRDRARWTIAPVSEFGILEMTRQRMRASHESQHFADCPTCRGRGLVQRPDSVAGESLRELAAMLDNPKVSRVEAVVHPRIAGELLSAKRRAISRIERASGKHVDVRVSDAIAVDRVTFYAYDERGADLDVSSLSSTKPGPEFFKVYEIKADAADIGEEWTGKGHGYEAADAQPDADLDEESTGEEPGAIHPIEIEPTQLSEYFEPVAPQRQGREDGGRGGHGGHGGHGGRGGRDSRDGQRPVQQHQQQFSQQPQQQQQQQPQRPMPAGGRGPGGGGGLGGEQFRDGPDGEMGEGGPRRRRRRRGGRGRNSVEGFTQQDGQPGGQPGYAQPGFNQPGFNQPGYDAPGYDQAGNLEGQYDDQGMDSNPAYADQPGVPRAEPGHDQAGYDQAGYNQAGYDQAGYDQAGYNQAGYDQAGFNQEGYDTSGNYQPPAPVSYGPDGQPLPPGDGQGPRRRRRRGGRGRNRNRGGPDGPGRSGGPVGPGGQDFGGGEFSHAGPAHGYGPGGDELRGHAEDYDQSGQPSYAPQGGYQDADGGEPVGTHDQRGYSQPQENEGFNGGPEYNHLPPDLRGGREGGPGDDPNAGPDDGPDGGPKRRRRGGRGRGRGGARNDGPAASADRSLDSGRGSGEAAGYDAAPQPIAPPMLQQSGETAGYTGPDSSPDIAGGESLLAGRGGGRGPRGGGGGRGSRGSRGASGAELRSDQSSAPEISSSRGGVGSDAQAPASPSPRRNTSAPVVVTPAPAPSGTGAKPRLLYGGVRRKLGPGDVKGVASKPRD